MNEKTINDFDFTNNDEIREYLIKSTMELVIFLKQQTFKKGSVKKPQIARVKNNYAKTCIDSIKALDNILKNKQLDKLEKDFKLLTNEFDLHNNKGASINGNTGISIDLENDLKNFEKTLNKVID